MRQRKTQLSPDTAMAIAQQLQAKDAEIATLRTELDQARAEVEAIPRTADGIRVTETNGELWRTESDGTGPIKRRAFWASGLWHTTPKKIMDRHDPASVGKCYSTQEAARTAKPEADRERGNELAHKDLMSWQVDLLKRQLAQARAIISLAEDVASVVDTDALDDDGTYHVGVGEMMRLHSAIESARTANPEQAQQGGEGE